MFSSLCCFLIKCMCVLFWGFFVICNPLTHLDDCASPKQPQRRLNSSNVLKCFAFLCRRVFFCSCTGGVTQIAPCLYVLID